jgi:hypothetical protein
MSNVLILIVAVPAVLSPSWLLHALLVSILRALLLLRLLGTWRIKR